MKQLRTYIILTLLVLAGNCSAFAEVRHIDLQQALELARNANPEIIRSEFDLHSAEASFRSVRAELFPSVRADVLAPNYSQSLSEQYIYNPDDGTYGWRWMPTGDYRYQGTIFLEQNLPTGGNLNISSMLYQRDYYIGTGTDNLETEYSSIIQMSVQQPLIQANSHRIRQKKGLLSLETAKLNAEIRRRDLDFIIAVAYYSIVRADKRLRLEEEDFERWQNSVQAAEDKFQAGLIPEVEVLKLQVELARRQGNLSATYSAYLNTADDLKLALGLGFDDSIAVVEKVEKISITAGDYDSAIVSRQELHQSRIQIDQAELNYKDIKAGFGINAYLQAYYLFDAKDPDLENITDNYEQDRGLSLTLSIPVLDWNSAKQQIESADLELKKTKYNFDHQKKELFAELKQTDRAVNAANSRLESSRLAEQLAEKSYQITLSRFESGAVTSTDLIDAQLSLNQARHELLDSIIDYNIAAVRYKTLFFPQIKKWGIQ
ncbi:MAG: TolC family protein [FCB group bacterium]|nr:TolC family protein [FCB group bacterium]